MNPKLWILALVAAASVSAAVTCSNPNSTQGIRGEAALLQGCLTGPGGLILIPPAFDSESGPGFTIAWNIEPLDSAYSYEYTLTTSSTANLSSLILGLSSTCTAVGGTSDACLWNLEAAGNDFVLPPAIFSIPGLITGLAAVPGNPSSTFNLSFLSQRVPVWQDVYLQNDAYVFAFNTGFLQSGSNFYIAAPGTQTVVPEPGQIAVMLLATIGCVAFGRRKV